MQFVYNRTVFIDFLEHLFFLICHRILVSDFNNFHDRAVPVDEINDPLSGNLFFLPGQKWRDLRAKFTPTFTSGKSKSMFPIIQECVDTLNTYLKKNIHEGSDTFEAKNFFFSIHSQYYFIRGIWH